MRRYLLILVCLLALTSCSSSSALMAIPTVTVPPPPPAATFPPIGEWEYLAPYSLTNDDLAFVLDIQRTNSTSNVASLTSVVGECVTEGYHRNGNPVRVSQPHTDVESAADTINGTDITVAGTVSYLGPLGQGLGIIYLYMTFSGTINSDGSLSLASSNLNGVHDYLFTKSSGAVAQIQQQFQQDKCN